jgi:hypothetical protein
MSTTAAIFTVLTAIFLGIGWVSINKKEKPLRRRGTEK